MNVYLSHTTALRFWRAWSAAHRSPHQQDHDSRKRHGLQVDGVDVTTVTSSQFHHIGECERLLTRRATTARQPSVTDEPGTDSPCPKPPVPPISKL